MNTINPTGLTLDGVIPKKPERTASDKLGQEQFLELMIAQLKNQDPMKPMQNGEFLGQMAQFGTVSGIQDLQKSFTELSTSLQSNQALMASSLVGRTVLAPAAGAQIGAGGGLRGVADLPGAASDVAVSITSASGQLVKRIDLGAQNQGEIGFVWDGTDDTGAAVPPGAYRVSVQALSAGQSYALNTLIESRVDSVTLGGANGLILNLAGLGPVNLSSVRQIS